MQKAPNDSCPSVFILLAEKITAKQYSIFCRGKEGIDNSMQNLLTTLQQRKTQNISKVRSLERKEWFLVNSQEKHFT